MSDNHAHAAAPDVESYIKQALKDLPDAADLDLANDTELGIPSAYEDEVIAGVGLEHADNLIVMRWKILNAKLNHEDDEVKKLAAAEMASRAILTRIKRERPAAYAVIQWALKKRAEANTKSRRDADAEVKKGV